MSQVLPAAINLGYQQYSGLVLERVNGEEIRNLAELSKRVDEAQGEFLIFEISDERSAEELGLALRQRGLDPVWKDWDRALTS